MLSSLERNRGGTGELLIEAVTAPRECGGASSIPQVCYWSPWADRIVFSATEPWS
jgi:hypothetical protein